MKYLPLDVKQPTINQSSRTFNAKIGKTQLKVYKILLERPLTEQQKNKHRNKTTKTLAAFTEQ